MDPEPKETTKEMLMCDTKKCDGCTKIFPADNKGHISVYYHRWYCSHKCLCAWYDAQPALFITYSLSHGTWRRGA